VRTGSINAGHTVVHDGKRIAFQQLPTPCVLPEVKSVLGPGAYVHLETLQREMRVADCYGRVHVDHNCGVHLSEYAAEAARAQRSLKIGATGKGCAEAIIHKIADRGLETPLLLRNFLSPEDQAQLIPSDTALELLDAHERGEGVLIEGAQGSLLDLHTGPYPYVTSRQTTAAAWVAEAGLPPSLDYEVVLVARTYPIRVAGNSGPMPHEISWPALARKVNHRLRELGRPALVAEAALQEYERRLVDAKRSLRSERFSDEREVSLLAPTEALHAMSEGSHREVMKLFETTTVTRRLRRVAELDVDQLRVTVRKERPAYLVLTFLNYVFPELAPEGDAGPRHLHGEALDYLSKLQDKIDCWIRYVSVGPRSQDVLETPAGFYRPFNRGKLP